MNGLFLDQYLLLIGLLDEYLVAAGGECDLVDIQPEGGLEGGGLRADVWVVGAAEGRAGDGGRKERRVSVKVVFLLLGRAPAVVVEPPLRFIPSHVHND